ncbi:DUF5333 domain-containing protein [Roseovarius tibetensis]|uniref:DUF5333 domain-containing protein n=1 Tax=Roseovarius tibetensis TaxID=2685897 RepID=UPI003D7FE384
MRVTLSLVLWFAMTATVVEARAGSLASEKDINTGLFNVAVADKIRRQCDEISPRLFTAMSYLQALKSEARKRGYSDAEIDRYIEDPAEKSKMRARRDAYIRASGAEPDEGPSMCTLGRQEIARQSQIGQLLKAR